MLIGPDSLTIFAMVQPNRTNQDNQQRPVIYARNIWRGDRDPPRLSLCVKL